MSLSATKNAPPGPAPEADFYIDGGRYVFTAAYLLRRGACCGSGCRHCPYSKEAQARAAARKPRER